jgi:hypothetical protein
MKIKDNDFWRLVMELAAKQDRAKRLELKRNEMPASYDVAVQNAKKGGRPRHGETVEEANKRRSCG